MSNETFSIADVKRIDLVEYLEKLGFKAERTRNDDYWYLSPLREERTPSFKVNRNLNCWFDFGTGEGGSIIDFGIKYFKTTIPEFLRKFNDNRKLEQLDPVSFHRKNPLQSAVNEDKNKIQIVDVRTIYSRSLITYLTSRSIDIDITRQYCSEVDFKLYNRCHTAIGFKNDMGGYELRNASFKGSSGPKFNTLIATEKEYNDLSVFEGFFDFLSYQTAIKSPSIQKQLPESQRSFLILNSLSFFEQSRSLMERHRSINLYLDRDEPGLKQTGKALKCNKKYKDCSEVYQGFKDFNDFLTNSPFRLEQKLRSGRRI